MALFTDEPQRLGDVLRALIDSTGMRTKINDARIVEMWAKIAGAHINRVTSNVWVRKGCLHVRLTSATWRHELHMRRTDWCAILNRKLGAPLVKEILFC